VYQRRGFVQIGFRKHDVVFGWRFQVVDVLVTASADETAFPKNLSVYLSTCPRALLADWMIDVGSANACALCKRIHTRICQMPDTITISA
jgi:hypothetical protein